MKTTDNSLILCLQVQLNKKIEEMTEDDFKMIESLSFDSRCIDGSVNINDFSKIKLFSNLKVINVNNAILSNESLSYFNLPNIQQINLINCTFVDDVDFSNISGITELSLNKCFVDDYSLLLKSLEKIKSVHIINPYDDNEIDIESLNCNLEVLVLEHCIIKNTNLLEKFDACVMLSLLNSSMDNVDLQFLKKMKSLKQLFISRKYMEEVNSLNLNHMIDVRFNLNVFAQDDIDYVSYKI